MPTITICSSVAFYRQVIGVRNQLEAMGYQVIVPEVAKRMEAANDYEVAHFKSWFANPDDYPKKGELMMGHFKEVAKGDVTLVLNYEKHGVANYIGGNVLMEMGLAFYLKKPIYILNEAPEDSSFLEEILGLGCVILHGKLEDIAKTLPV